MQNAFKRIILVLLAVMLIMSSVAIPAFASDSPTPTSQTSIAKATVTLVKKSAAYTGAKHSIQVKVVLNGVTLVEGTDYILSGNETSGKTCKTYTVKPAIVGIGKYKNYIVKSFSYTITKRTNTLAIETTSFTVKYTDLKKGSIKVSPNASAKTSRVYSLPSGKGFKVHSSGNIVIPKGLAKGTYTIKVYAKETSTYKKSATKTITIKVK